MSYTQLAQGERYQIYALKKAGHDQAEIAKIMGRDRGTISRELHLGVEFTGLNNHKFCENQQKKLFK